MFLLLYLIDFRLHTKQTGHSSQFFFHKTSKLLDLGLQKLLLSDSLQVRLVFSCCGRLLLFTHHTSTHIHWKVGLFAQQRQVCRAYTHAAQRITTRVLRNAFYHSTPTCCINRWSKSEEMGEDSKKRKTETGLKKWKVRGIRWGQWGGDEGRIKENRKKEIA